MKKWCLIFVLMAIVVGISSLSVAQEEQEEALPFRVGETIHYKIKKFGIKTGEAKLIFKGRTRINYRDAYLIVFRAEAMNFIDEESIYLDPETFYPIMVKRVINLWGKKEKISEEYFHDKGFIKIVKESNGETTDMSIRKEGPFDNIYGFIYRYRLKGKFEADEELKINLPTKNLEINFIEETQVKAVYQKTPAYYLESNPKQFRIWFDKSDDRVPLRIDGAIGFGSTSMVMVEYEKYTLNSDQ